MQESKASSETLREMGLKATRARISVVKVLERSSKKHLSVEEVSQALSKMGLQISLGTVYRVLTDFEKVDIVRRLNFENGYAVYELKHEERHDHLVCLHCGRVEEFYDEDIERLQKKIAEQAGFKIADSTHVIYGFCSCRNAVNENCDRKRESANDGL